MLVNESVGGSAVEFVGIPGATAEAVLDAAIAAYPVGFGGAVTGCTATEGGAVGGSTGFGFGCCSTGAGGCCFLGSACLVRSRGTCAIVGLKPSGS